MTHGLAPFATHRLMPYADSLPAREDSPTLILHTNGGGTDHGSLYGWFSRPDNHDRICAHFQVMSDGTIEQYLPITRQGYAQFSGNDYAVSVETQDDGHPAHKWTPAQVAAIVKLARWLEVPARVSHDKAGGGIGWHSLYADWNRSDHNCPGSVRVAQIHDEVLPDLAATTGPHPGGKHPHPTHHKPAASRAYPARKGPFRKGSMGEFVLWIQERLSQRLDAQYGPETERAVKAFQHAHGLEVDGVVGQRTWSAMFSR